MAYATITSNNATFLFSSSRFSKLLTSSSFPRFNINKKKKYSLPLAAASSASFSYPPLDSEYLRREFSGHGVTFEDIGVEGKTCIAKLALENGCSATVVLPQGIVTSYKVAIWHGGKMELLHTWVSEDESEEEEEDGEVVIQGGVSSAFHSDQLSSWSLSSDWILQDIAGDSKEYLQMKLVRRDNINMVEIKQIITLKEETLSCDLIVSNINSSPIQIKCCFLSHLTVSTPEATYAVGLQASNFINIKPFLPSPDTIIEDYEEDQPGFNGNEEEIEYEELSNYKQLNEEMSRIYTCAPQSFTIIDRGRRNSVIVGREGFEEVYIFSPGSRLESYSKSDYICIAQSALLNPITLKPGGQWRGVQHLHNPNS